MKPPRSWRAPRAAHIYCALQLLYPRSFRQAYGAEMVQTFRDRVRAAQQMGRGQVLRLYGAEFSDLVATALKEQVATMRTRLGGEKRTATRTTNPPVPARLWHIRITTVMAVLVALLASVNLYLLEDASVLTAHVYAVSPLLHVSYTGVYVSALVAGVDLCAVVGASMGVAATPMLGCVALLVAFGGFGGLLVRHPVTFLVLFVAFGGLLLASMLLGSVVAARTRAHLGSRQAVLLGACLSTGVAVFVNLICLMSHTLVLNPANHALYMQAQLPGTRLNSLLLAGCLAVVATCGCVCSILLTLRRLQRAFPGRSARLS
jgi:hypothetical protein